MHTGTPAHSCGHTSSELPREPKSALQTHISFQAHPPAGLPQLCPAAGLAGRWSRQLATEHSHCRGYLIWPFIVSTTATADDILSGPLLQVKQEKAAEKHNQKVQIQIPTRGSTQHHILIWLFFIDSDKETCEKCTGYSFKLCAYDSSKNKNPLTVSLHASPPN